MKKLMLIFALTFTMASAEVNKTNLAKGVVITALGAIAFPGILVAEVHALVLQRNDICDENHNVYVYVPLPKTGGLEKAKFAFTCSEWVAD